ncbi:5294_t:CDS:2 [Acaulospora colombiana]|uniref:5294_t:CDS:1 n=1 Tax=Acaulospora colombiana TaxID=27376 RepID=A0ACA9MI86_9GLOM|nr:5294_t:CDS:2 [Acaulospora colombiana]
MAYAKLDFDDKPQDNLKSLLTIGQDEETAEDMFMEELKAEAAENPQAMAALASQLLSPTSTKEPESESIQLLPNPGFVAKALTKKSYKHNQPTIKFMINVCHSDLIPGPPAVDEAEIRKAMDAKGDTTYNVPAVLGELREDKDKDQNTCLVCDVIIHTEPYRRTKKDPDFKLYITELAAEMIEEQYDLQLSRPFAYPKMHYKGNIREKPVVIPKRKNLLITEIPFPSSKQKSSEDQKSAIKITSLERPEYIIAYDRKDTKDYLIISIETPSLESKSFKQTTLDLESSRLILHSPEKYSLDITLPFQVDITTATAKYVKSKKRFVRKNWLSPFLMI